MEVRAHGSKTVTPTLFALFSRSVEWTLKNEMCSFALGLLFAAVVT